MVYDCKKIADELTATALGRAHFGNALRVAKDIPGMTPEDRSVLDRFATGANSASDGLSLQDIANKLVATGIRPAAGSPGEIQLNDDVLSPHNDQPQQEDT